ncbi:hypothetical protein DL93DRAFT_2208326 [Clavulina sp. PMI_390]|nr:hypothetical protein DL93DRAFT_2208326 [Clavulina sp. PMI_390]
MLSKAIPSKAIPSFSCSRRRGENEPQALTFSEEWGVGPTFDWYKTLKTTKIESIEIRIDVGGVVPHRFVLTRMCDNRIHRFDRRPQQPDHARELEHGPVDLLLNHPVACEDTYVPDVGAGFLSDIQRLSHCEIMLSLDGHVDLKVVLAVCYIISKDSFAQKYTFLRHNCFFLSWTIFMSVSRHYLPYSVPNHERLMTRLESSLKPLTSLIVNEAMELFLDLVLDTAGVFRRRIDRSLRGGVIAVAWAMPPKLLRFLWRRYFALKLHFGLRKHLETSVKRQIQERVPGVYESIVTTFTQSNSLDSNLWIEGARKSVETEIGEEVAKILWDAILEAISFGVPEAGVPPEEQPPVGHRLKFSLLGKQSAQFFAVWNLILVTGISSAKAAGQGHHGTLTSGAVFDRVWDAAGNACFAPAKALVESTNGQVGSRKRAAMWEQIWKIWDNAWKEARDIVRPRTLGTVEKITSKIIETSGKNVIQEMQDPMGKRVKVSLAERKPFKSQPHLGSPFHISSGELEHHMQEKIKGNTMSAEILAVTDSMSRIWTGMTSLTSDEDLHIAPVEVSLAS